MVAASTIAPPTRLEPAGLYFNPPRPWLPEFTHPLNIQGRFQGVTIEELKNVSIVVDGVERKETGAR